MLAEQLDLPLEEPFHREQVFPRPRARLRETDEHMAVQDELGVHPLLDGALPAPGLQPIVELDLLLAQPRPAVARW